MNGLGDRFDALVTAAVGDYDPPPVDELVAKGRRRRNRRRIVTAGGSLGAVVAVVAGVAVGQTDSSAKVATSLSPVTANTGEPPLAAIAALSASAAATRPGPPAALGEVVGTTASAVRAMLDGPTTANKGSARGDIAATAATSTTSLTAHDGAVWWVLITRHQPCPPGCADASGPLTDHVTVVLRARDLRVLEVRPEGSNTPNLALAGPVYPLVLPGQTLPSRQPVVTEAVVPAASVEAAALESEGCPVPGRLSGLRDSLPAAPGAGKCTGVSVRLYPNWYELSSSIPGVVEPGLAFSQPSRPIYYVTTWGKFAFAFKTLAPTPAYVDHDNGIYDAATGQGEGGGTAGEPLP